MKNLSDNFNITIHKIGTKFLKNKWLRILVFAIIVLIMGNSQKVFAYSPITHGQGGADAWDRIYGNIASKLGADLGNPESGDTTAIFRYYELRNYFVFGTIGPDGQKMSYILTECKHSMKSLFRELNSRRVDGHDVDIDVSEIDSIRLKNTNTHDPEFALHYIQETFTRYRSQPDDTNLKNLIFSLGFITHILSDRYAYDIQIPWVCAHSGVGDISGIADVGNTGDILEVTESLVDAFVDSRCPKKGAYSFPLSLTPPLYAGFVNCNPMGLVRNITWHSTEDTLPVTYSRKLWSYRYGRVIGSTLFDCFQDFGCSSISEVGVKELYCLFGALINFIPIIQGDLYHGLRAGLTDLVGTDEIYLAKRGWPVYDFKLRLNKGNFQLVVNITGPLNIVTDIPPEHIKDAVIKYFEAYEKKIQQLLLLYFRVEGPIGIVGFDCNIVVGNQFDDEGKLKKQAIACYATSGWEGLFLYQWLFGNFSHIINMPEGLIEGINSMNKNLLAIMGLKFFAPDYDPLWMQGNLEYVFAREKRILGNISTTTYYKDFWEEGSDVVNQEGHVNYLEKCLTDLLDDKENKFFDGEYWKQCYEPLLRSSVKKSLITDGLDRDYVSDDTFEAHPEVQVYDLRYISNGDTIKIISSTEHTQIKAEVELFSPFWSKNNENFTLTLRIKADDQAGSYIEDTIIAQKDSIVDISNLTIGYALEHRNGERLVYSIEFSPDTTYYGYHLELCYNDKVFFTTDLEPFLWDGIENVKIGGLTGCREKMDACYSTYGYITYPENKNDCQINSIRFDPDTEYRRQISGILGIEASADYDGSYVKFILNDSVTVKGRKSPNDPPFFGVVTDTSFKLDESKYAEYYNCSGLINYLAGLEEDVCVRIGGCGDITSLLDNGGTELQEFLGSKILMEGVKANDSWMYIGLKHADRCTLWLEKRVRQREGAGILENKKAIPRSNCWRVWPPGEYWIYGSITVPNDSILTIKPYSLLKFDTCGINVDGGLRAIGFEDGKIVFTSIKDAPSPGDWKKIYFKEGSLGENNLLEHCIIEYGGGDGGVNASNIFCEDTVTIRKCEVSHSKSFGIKVDRAICEITNVTIHDNDSFPMYMYADLPAKMRNFTTYGNYDDVILVMNDRIEDDITWYNSGIPYYIYGGDKEVFVYPDNEGDTTTLTIEPGLEVRFQSEEDKKQLVIGYYSDQNVEKYGALVAQGSPDNPIVFTSYNDNPQPGDWYGILFQRWTADCQTVLENCVISYGKTNIRCISCDPTIDNCEIKYGSMYGISCSPVGYPSIDRPGMPMIRNCQFVENDSFAIKAYKSYPPQITNCQAVGRRVDGIKFVNGGKDKKPKNITWTNAGMPYIFYGSWDIDTNRTLTIEPGVVIKFTELENGWFTVQGGIIAEGTVDDSIIFTSYNNPPASGDWHIFRIWDQNTTPDSRRPRKFDYCVFEYGDGVRFYGDSTYLTNSTIQNMEFNALEVDVNNEKKPPIISNSIITDNERIGINVIKNTPFITNNTISKNDSFAIVTPVGGLHRIYDNVYTENQNNAILLSGGLTSKDTVWQNQEIPYVVDCNITIRKEDTLTINPGAEFRFEPGKKFEINGYLKCPGAENDKITFTSNKETPNPGDWCGLNFTSSVDASELNYCRIRYAENGISSEYKSSDTMKLYISNGEIDFCKYNGIKCTENNKLFVEGNSIHDNDSSGIYFYHTYGGSYLQAKISGNSLYNNYNGVKQSGGCFDTLFIKNNNIHNNIYGVDSRGGSNIKAIIIEKNNIYNNSTYGVFRSCQPAEPFADADSNWWGDVTGPYHPYWNPTGLGDTVSDSVYFIPWALEPFGIGDLGKGNIDFAITNMKIIDTTELDAENEKLLKITIDIVKKENNEKTFAKDILLIDKSSEQPLTLSYDDDSEKIVNHDRILVEDRKVVESRNIKSNLQGKDEKQNISTNKSVEIVYDKEEIIKQIFRIGLYNGNPLNDGELISSIEVELRENTEIIVLMALELTKVDTLYAFVDPYDEYEEYEEDNNIYLVDLLTTGIANTHGTDNGKPKVFSFSQNYPNPFNSSTNICYGLPENIHVSLKIYNTLGQEIITLVDSNQEAGFYNIIWNGKDVTGKDLSSNVYFVQLKSGDYTATRKILMMK